MKLIDIFLDNAKEHYKKSDGYFWEKTEGKVILYKPNGLKVFTLKLENKDLALHDVTEAANIENLLDFARLERFLKKKVSETKKERVKI